MQYLYLASRSPRRRELLQQAGIPFRLIDIEVDESVLEDEAAADYVERLARDKARAGVASQGEAAQSAPVLAADTTVAEGTHILGKPETPAEAVDMLMHLSGREHTVYTGIAMALGDRLESRVVATRVCFASFRRADAERYVATGEPMDKAGAYGIQGFGGVLVERIEGSYSNVVGLPVYETATLAAEFGVACWQTETL
ncbi:Maf family protein [Parendozoicomonas haliclonae]|uniref:dTTP/UTP pyrophosphatase n=1 Tax=Parendozoicomonas haliclonae TaxID=1960125 RepID=A0A1X7AFW8_9GAMM|nr:nucleoside triphosphate pyrophosphatase [Parendozoicomonas haliclonae]SMA37360.1 Maf-like protein YhdE [Parendozoicomonas haliclonae]